MNNNDLHNNIHPLIAIAPVAARTDNTAIVSSIVDTRGYNACEFVIVTGTNTDADVTFTVLVEDADEVAFNVTNAAVPDSGLLGTELLAGFAFGDDGETRKIGYIGGKRFVRVTITPANNGAGDIFLAAVWILGSPSLAPTANPPV